VYNRTKLMNIWFTQALATSLAETTITANCASPGFVRTRLARDATGFFAVFIRLAAPFQSSPEAAATTLVHLITSPQMSGQTGGYYSKSRRAEPGGLADDPRAAFQLWRLSAELSGTTDISGR
jgi:NAD(P)-dependent dehydrogenase (short-subunit alcohol dehydrogenase family)